MSAREAGIGIVSLIAGGVIGGLTWAAIGTKEDTIDKTADDAPVAGTQNADDLQSQNALLKSQIAGLRVELNRKKLAAAEEEVPEKSEVVTAEAPIPQEVLFGDPKYQEALASIDWATVGQAMKDMVPLAAKLAEQLENGEELDLAVAGELQKLNGELLKAAQKIMEGNIPGTGINGSFTHPVVAANQIGAALKAAGLDLSKEQKDNLERAMQFYAAKDHSLRLAEGDREFKLDILGEELEFKDAFYKEARRMLTKEQRDVLYSERSAGRAGFDVFDSSLMTAGMAKPLKVKDAAELASKLSRSISSSTGLDAAGRKQLDAIITKWSNEFPAEFWSNKGNALDKRGALSGARVRAALKRQSALMREILANIKLSPDARARLLRNMSIFVPLPR
jgi:hypothetical protein